MYSFIYVVVLKEEIGQPNKNRVAVANSKTQPNTTNNYNGQPKMSTNLASNSQNRMTYDDESDHETYGNQRSQYPNQKVGAKSV